MAAKMVGQPRGECGERIEDTAHELHTPMIRLMRWFAIIVQRWRRAASRGYNLICHQIPAATQSLSDE